MTDTVDFNTLTLSEASRSMKLGELSPVTLVEETLERIERVNPRLNCFITLTPELALENARQAETELRKGEWRGELHGIPIALKDLYATKGILTTAGSKFFSANVPDRNAATVEKLEQAGAILLGKLNMHEIALGVTTVNPHFGPSRNPWDTEKICGGSSGGSAAALAAGLCLGSLGTDTGGSIRIPASLCGVVGLKPTTGRVSLRGVIPLSWNLDHAGPMGRVVRDTAVLLQAIAGYDPDDPYSVNVPTEDYIVYLTEGVRGWRVALASDEFFTAKTDPQVQNCVFEAGKVFAQMGAVVKETGFPMALEAAQANQVMTTSDAAAFHRERLAEHAEDFGEDVRIRLQAGAERSATEYILARRMQTLLRQQFVQFFRDYDLLITPATPVAALPMVLGPDAIAQARLLTRFTSPFNLTGLPAISVPCGFTSEGLPVGLQLIARPWAEASLLRAAYAYEQTTEWHQRWPAWE